MKEKKNKGNIFPVLKHSSYTHWACYTQVTIRSYKILKFDKENGQKDHIYAI